MGPRPLARACAFAIALFAPAAADASVLQSSQTFYGVPSIPPLNSQAVWAMQDPFSPPFSPHEMLSLVEDAHQQNSFAWPLYIQLSATTSPQATINTSQSTGAQVRLFNSSTGSPWATAFHAELYHGRAGANSPVTRAGGTSLDYNAEVTRYTPTGLVYGMELNTLGPFPPDAAIHVDGRWKLGINLNGNDIQARRYVLAPGVFVDYEHGRICLHRAGRIVARF